MSQIPIQNARLSTLALARASLANIARTQTGLYRLQSQLSTGVRVARPSDDPVAAATISIIDTRLETADQRLRNLQHAASSLNSLDAALGELHDVVLEAKALAAGQLNLPSNPEERRSQALVIDSLLQAVFSTANQTSQVGYMFGGSVASSQPVLSQLGGYRFVSHGPGLITDLGDGVGVPLTLPPNHPIGALSARQLGTVDLDPALTPDTRLDDLRGARGLGIDRATIEFSFNGGPRASVDLSHADTIGDVADALLHAIRTYEADNDVTILAGEGVSITETGLRIQIVPASSPEEDNPTLAFFDPEGSTAAADLGLASSDTDGFSADQDDGADLEPILTWRSPVGLIDGLPLGSIRINNAGRTAVVDLSSATTLQDIKNLIEGANLGLRVVINAAGTGIDILNELAAGSESAMSIEEVEGNDLTATRLGIRTLARDTRLADFNDGRGVEIITGSVDPVSGQATPDKDVDFTITLGDGRAFDVNLRPQDILTVGTLLDRINDLAEQAGIAVPDEFAATLLDGPNGIALTQDPAIGGTLTVQPRNGSPAAFHLGLADASYDPDSATLIGQDRAKVRVDNLFTHLIDLRDALNADDTIGISLAGERLEQSVSDVVNARALVGGYARRVRDATAREEDRMLLDQQTRSTLQDADFAQAAVRFSLLQTQLQAGMQTASLLNGQTLLDFLG